MVTNGPSKVGASAAPPHELNVLKFAESRASELEGLHTIVAGRLDNNFRSQRNKRRRTTGHDDRVAKRKIRKRRNVEAGNMHEKTDLARNKVPRRVRRNIELKKNPESGFGTSGDGTKRLRTHVWHAKRFTMEKRWGFYIPLGLHGVGRGSRALLKKLRNGVLVHDASYYGSVQLEGPQVTLMSVLSSVLVPSPSACCEEKASHDILAGDSFGTAMLHHAGKACFPPIAPVTYMWLSLQPTSDGEQNVHDDTVTRKLCVWVHAAAFDEAFDSLSSACGRQTDTTCSAHCVSREGQLAKIELVGSKVFELLQKTMLLNSCNSENSCHLKKFLDNEHQTSSTAVVSMVVKDPRLLTKKENVIAPEEIANDLLSNEKSQIKEQSNSSLLKHEAECVPQCSDLWDASKVVCLPLEESVLCMEKHCQRKKFFRIAHKSTGPQSSVDGEYSRACPVLLLKNVTNEDSVTRCSIILPLSWVKAFWNTFVSNGAHAIGLREKHWVACELGLPYFPFDFPDCNAYTDFMAMEAAELSQKASLRPSFIRPFEVPVPPPWDCVHLTLDIKSGNEKNEDGEKKSDCHGNAFEGIIARTSCILSDHQSGNHMLLFPRKPGDEKNSLYKFMRDKEFIEQDTAISEVQPAKTMFYVRVHLRAFKEGVFEQGAVICAPHTDDILLWKDSLECDDQQLQIPQSSLKSYFLKLPSGKWELQIPEDQALHRWPVGFVTSGFVRGSKKTSALAICEASLLSMLREEQWKAVAGRQRKKEIYVLVRNMRSNAYRLALATIVLEEQEQDVEFM